MTSPAANSHAAGSSVPAFSIAVESDRDAARVTPTGEIDLATAPQLRDQLRGLIATGCPRIVLDLRRVLFLDSNGLHAIIDAHARAQREKRELTLIPGPAAVQRMFEITGTAELLPFVAAPVPDPVSPRASAPQRMLG